MRIRPGRTRSLISGIMVLVVMTVGLIMMSQTGGFMVPGVGGVFGIFKILWILVGLIGAGVSFYNAFSREGVALYEVETERGSDIENDQFCPQCGEPVGSTDRFCRNCGHALKGRQNLI